MFYSKQTGGFYTREIHGDNIPADAVEITPEQHAALLQGQSEGKVITADENGHPVLIDPPPAPEPSLADAQAQQIAIINAAFESAAEALAAGYPATERLTWPVQQAEALAWAANPAAPTPYLDGLAAARGITPEEMRQLTLDQVNLFLAASQQLVGLRQRLRDQINAAETIEAVRAVVWPNPET